jgi:two-component system, cell cycle response regulator CpdR
MNPMIGLVLQGQGYHLIVAEDGRHALELANSFGRIDVLLSDIQMPGLAGPDLAQELLRSRPDLKIVLMSGCVSSVNVSNRQWRFLQKPFAVSRLLEEVRTALV